MSDGTKTAWIELEFNGRRLRVRIVEQAQRIFAARADLERLVRQMGAAAIPSSSTLVAFAEGSAALKGQRCIATASDLNIEPYSKQTAHGGRWPSRTMHFVLSNFWPEFFRLSGARMDCEGQAKLMEKAAWDTLAAPFGAGNDEVKEAPPDLVSRVARLEAQQADISARLDKYRGILLGLAENVADLERQSARPGSLADDQIAAFKRHVAQGYAILKKIEEASR